MKSGLPLCRMTSHLTMAQFLNGTNSYGINGQMAEATLLTLVNDRASGIATTECRRYERCHCSSDGSCDVVTNYGRLTPFSPNE